MPIMKKGSHNNWTTLDNHCFYDKNLSYKEIGLLCNMLSLPDNWKFNVRGLASLHIDGVESVSNTLNSLIEKGYVYREQPNSAKGFREIVYWIYQNPDDNPHFRKENEESPCTENPYTGIQDTEESYTESNELSSINVFNTNELNTEISVTVTEEEPIYSPEEIDSWTNEEFYAHLNDEQYEALNELLRKSMIHKIRSSKESLILFFRKMMANGWRDAQGKPIRNIVSYVTTIFNAVTEKKEIEKQLKEIEEQEDDGLPVYDTSKNPPFDEDEFNRIMDEIRKERK